VEKRISKQLQTFLESEVERVQGEIESALAGIKIIIETIAAWCARFVREQILNPQNFVGDR
jgi:hypothetical protein